MVGERVRASICSNKMLEGSVCVVGATVPAESR